MSNSTDRVIWVFSDGKPGHENQSMGLVDSLAEWMPLQHHRLPPVSRLVAVNCLLTRRLPREWKLLPRPDIILGAGQATHLSILAAGRALAESKTIVLMRPSLPMRFFDLCLVPEHDAPPARNNVMITRGPLNRIKPPIGNPSATNGLFLIGGPCKHYEWEDEKLIAQIQRIIDVHAGVHWTLTTSRRTPEKFLQLLKQEAAPNLFVVPAAQTPRGWVAEQLSRCATVWVSEDSASMVYEALTAGAAVGVLSVEADSSEREARSAGRVARGLDQLTAQGIVTRFEDWRRGRQLATNSAPMSEASRCSRLIFEQWWGTASGRRAEWDETMVRRTAAAIRPFANTQSLSK